MKPLQCSEFFLVSPEFKLSKLNCFYQLRERQEHKVFLALLKSAPGLEARLMSTNSEDEVLSITTVVSFI